MLSYAQTQFLGKWLSEEKDGIVEIYKEGNLYQGKLIKMIPEQKENGKPILDKHNPDKSKCTRKVLGIDTFIDFKYDDGELTNGKLYDPKSGKNYKGKLWIEEGNLMVRGYIGFLYETQTWTRVKEK